MRIPRAKRFGPALLLLLLVAIAYAPAVRNGFVWDDTALVLRDPLIRSWRLIPEGFRHFLFTDATASDFYRPMQRLLFTFEYCAFAVNPLAYHVVSILAHAAAAIALWCFATEMLRIFGLGRRSVRVATFFAVLAWAVHPVHNAAVDYVSGCADPLAACFGFAALYVALGSERAKRSWVWLLFAASLFLLSALSKESGLIFPVAWLTILILRRKWRPLIPWAVVSVTIVCIYLTLRLSAEHISPPTFHPPAPPLVRPIVVARAFAEYGGLILAPWRLHMERDVETRPTGPNEASAVAAAWRELQTLLGILLLGAAILWAVRRRKREPAAFAFLALATLAYLPVSGLLLLNATVAEHWLYLPSAFLLPAAAVVLSRFTPNARACRLILALGLAWIGALGARSFMRATDWKDQQTFFTNTIATGGDTARMLINLAGVEMNAGDLAGAEKHLRIALAKDPDQPLAIVNLGAVAIKRHDFAAAHAWLDRAEKMAPVAAQAQELQVVLTKAESGNVDLARLERAARMTPRSWQIEKRYLRVLAESGAGAAAIADLRALLQHEWYRAESWELLAELLVLNGRQDESAAAKERAQAYDVHLGLRPPVL